MVPTDFSQSERQVVQAVERMFWEVALFVTRADTSDINRWVSARLIKNGGEAHVPGLPQ